MADPTLLGAIHRGCNDESRLFIGRDEGGMTTSDMWALAGSVARQLDEQTVKHSRTAVVLSATAETIASLLGCWRAGRDVISLPARSRSVERSEHEELVRQIVEVSGARQIIADPSMLPASSSAAVGVPVLDPSDLTGAPSRSGSMIGGALIQFTSGSTGAPKGIVLTPSSVLANIESILDVTPAGPPTSVSWLPLSHDMGLLMLLTSLVAFGPDRAGRGSLHQLQPESFATAPGSWMSLSSRVGATVTAGPDFALRIAARRMPADGLDLSSLGMLIVGSEPIRADTLRAFEQAAGPHGFDGAALCPAYGLAEATVGVTLGRPGQPWRSVRVDPAYLAENGFRPSVGGTEFVSCGAPLPGMDVAISVEEASHVGRVAVRGPSLFEGYLGLEGGPNTDGWFTTSDLGAVQDGELFVTGRVDDLMFVAGRNLYPSDIEREVDKVPGVREGHAVAVADGDGFAIVCERRLGRSVRESLDQHASEARGRVLRSVGVGPSRVIFVKPGSLPRTTSGKPKRSSVRALLDAGDLDIEVEATFGRARAARHKPEVTS